MDRINFHQGHIFAFSKRLLWLVGNLQLRLVKPLHAHHGHVPGDDDDDGDDGDGDDDHEVKSRSRVGGVAAFSKTFARRLSSKWTIGIVRVNR